MASTIITPEEWTSSMTGYYSIEIGSELFELQSASKPWTITVPEADVVRFELRDGNQHWWDVQVHHDVERAELADRATIANGTPVHISYDFTLDPGEPNTAWFMVLGQLHQDLETSTEAWSPPYAFGLVGEKMAITINHTGADGQPVSEQLFLDVADIIRGHKYDIDIKAVIDPYGDGRLVVTIDGVTVCDYSGPIGYIGNNGVYWSEGIYRHANATETVAAEYGHLKIDTGADVTFPDKSDFIGAPNLTLDDIDYPTNGDHIFNLTGEAKPGTTVRISENGLLLGTAEVDASGHFSLDVRLTTDGQHNFSAVAVDDSGRRGITAAPMTIEISTAADIVARMDTIAQNTGLAAIILTDMHVLTVASGFQMRVFLTYTDAMDKIEGDFSFRVTNSVSGQASYNRQDELYDSHGVLTERLRYASDTLVYDEKIGANGLTTVATWKADGTSEFTEVDHGRIATYSQYNAAHVLVFKQINSVDGTREIERFNPTTGAMISDTIYRTDGSRTITTLGITGKDYTQEASTFDSAGKLVQLERSAADGTTLFLRTWAADGSTDTHIYDATGKETSFLLLEGDGSRVEGSFGITGQAYSGRVLSYDKLGVMTERDLFDAAGHLLSVETFGTSATMKVIAYNSSFFMTGYTLYAADHSYEVVTFVAGSETKIAQKAIYDSTGTLVDTLLYDDNGNVYGHLGDDVRVYSYNATTGLAIGYTTTSADGSYIVTKFVAGHEELTISASKYSAQGGLYEIDTFDTNGHFIAAEIRNEDGSKEFHNYNPLTHDELSYKIVYADKSREEVNLAVTGKTFAQQFATYDATGKLVEMTRKYGDADHTVALFQQNHTNGSSELHNYDTLGRETSETLTARNGARDVLNYTYSGSAEAATTVQQVHYGASGAKQWMDYTKADGSHLQTSYAKRVELTSHADVSDTMVGYAGGCDTFVFNEGFGKDTITGFHVSAVRFHDTIEFDTDLVSDFSELAGMMTKRGADTVITFDDSDVLVLKGISLSSLSEKDFSFVDHHSAGAWHV
jgi:hypothetical protein